MPYLARCAISVAFVASLNVSSHSADSSEALNTLKENKTKIKHYILQFPEDLKGVLFFAHTSQISTYIYKLTYNVQEHLNDDQILF